VLAYGFGENYQFAIKTDRNFVFLDCDTHILNRLHIMVSYMSFYRFLKKFKFLLKIYSYIDHTFQTHIWSTFWASVLPNLGPIITIHPKRTEPHLSHRDSGGKKLLKKENEKKRGDAEYKGSECYGVLFLDDSGLGSKDAAPATNRVEQPHSSVQT
jgi:hypothetical protein